MEENIGIIRKLLGRPEPVDVMRLDLHMSYTIRTGEGVAATEWIALASDDVNLRPLLLGLLYARILGIHGESREQLFRLINDFAAANANNQGKAGCTFPDWRLDVGKHSAPQTIWPWLIQNGIESLADAKLYQATLLGFPDVEGQGSFGIHLKTAFGLERVMVPASILIAISSYVEGSDHQGCYELAVLLGLINEFYGRPDGVRVGNEGAALMAALAAVRAEA